MFNFAVDYFILVFVGSLGVIQVAASIGGLRGLLLVKRPIVVRSLGIALVIVALAWFFSVDRIINDTVGGLNSNQQGLLFFLAVVCSGALTLLVSTLVNRRMQNDDAAPDAGLEALRGNSWAHALQRNWLYWFSDKRCCRVRIKRYFFG